MGSQQPSYPDRLKYRAIKDGSSNPAKPSAIYAAVPEWLKEELNRLRGRRSWARFLQDIAAKMRE